MPTGRNSSGRKLTIDFDHWDATRDALMFQPGSVMAWKALFDAVEVPKFSTVLEREQDSLANPIIQGVYEILAAALVYLRKYGETPETLAQRVTVLMNRETGKKQSALYRNRVVADAIEKISDPNLREARMKIPFVDK